MSLYDDASLVMIPSGYKDGKLYSVKPSDGAGDFTFTRGSNLAATRVDENGLIEKGRENLLLQSNQFDTTWAGNGPTLTSGQSGYDGSSDAWLLTKTAASFKYIYQDVTSSGVNTYSLYAKADTLNQVTIFINSATTSIAKFSLVDGSLVYSINIIDSNAEDVGNGWWRISILVNESITRARIYPDYEETTSGSIYIQDAQLEVGLVATDYIETGATTAQAGILEDMPRLDYSGGTCPALLLEPQRTNLLAHSEYFGGYTNVNSTDEVNTTTSSEGLVNATSFLEAATTGQHKLTTSYSFDGSSTYTFSIFAKSNGRDLYIDTQNSNEWGGRAWFDLTNGTANSVLGSASIQDVGNGWYRCIVTGASTLAGGNFIELLTSNGSSNSITGDITKGVYIYGAQLEAGSYPTSYIPTYGTSVTRGADSCSKTGVSSLIGQTEGTFYAEFTRDELEAYTQRVLTLSDGTTNNIIGLQLASNNSLTFYVENVGVNQVILIKSSATTANQKVKIAAAYASNDFVFYVDGVQVGTDSGGSIPSTSQIKFNRPTGGVPFIGNLHQILLFKTRLSNAELAALTTL